jgi:plastocyanin
MRKPITWALLLALVLLAAACGGSDSPGTDGTGEPTDTEEPCVDQTGQDLMKIEMGDNFFEPECLIVLATQPISIENTGTALHNFQLPGTQVDVDVSPGEPFNGEGNAVAPGEYEMVCKYHPEMTGTLTAQ